MTRAVAFLCTRAEPLVQPGQVENQGRRARAIGNALRELDHFLNVLVRATRVAADGKGEANRRNTARELSGLRTALSLPDPSYPRLRALGRSRACLFHCAGIVRRADERGGAWMTTGWSSDGDMLDRLRLGETLSPTAANLIDTCRFYDGIAADLLSIASHPLSYRDVKVRETGMHRLDHRPLLILPTMPKGGPINRVAGDIDNFGPAATPTVAPAVALT